MSVTYHAENEKRRSAGALPPKGYMGRWTPRDKQAVAERVLRGELTRDQAMSMYLLAPEELDAWCEGHFKNRRRESV